MDSNQQIVMGSDHAGYALKHKLMNQLTARGYEVIDKGTFSEERADYPDYAHAVASEVAEKNLTGVVICGSGNGVCMSANKHKGVRCALCWTEEIATLARAHNNANIISIPARFVDEETAVKMVVAFLGTEFEGGRHSDRVNKIEI